MWGSNVDIKSLVGEVLTNIDVFDEEILLTTKSGREIRVYHDQDCCESVYIEGTEGDWKQLIGKVILEVEEDIECNEDANLVQEHESYTKTTLTFKVDGETVINRWFGCSNGYYSESVDFREINKNET